MDEMKLCRDGWVGCDSKHLVCDMGCIDVFVKKKWKKHSNANQK